MRVIPPIAITDAMVLSTTAAEPGVGEVAWSGAPTAWATGAKAILAAPTDVVTMSIASPGVVTWTNHGLSDGIAVYFTTTGALPTGVTAGRLYYMVNSTANTFNIAEVPDGVPLVFTGSQSGTHHGVAHIHRVFSSLQDQDGSVGHSPADAPTWWQQDGPTNRWAMFDLLTDVATQVASPLTVTVAPGQGVDSIALLGLVADAVTITATSVTGGGTVYSYTATLPQRVRSAWSGYAFATFVATSPVVRFDLPNTYDDIQITVTLTRSSGLVSCAYMVLGNSIYLGRALHNAVNSSLNFSEFDRDTFGYAAFVARRTVPKASIPFRTDKSNVPTILDVREMLNAVPAVWAGLEVDDDGYFSALLMLAFYRTLDITADQPNEALCQLELEGP